jgi:hypothetical protein
VFLSARRFIGLYDEFRAERKAALFDVTPLSGKAGAA